MVLALLGWAIDWGYSDKRLTNNAFAAGAAAMTHEDLIIDLFCRVDDRMLDLPKHPQAALWPSELVTLGLLFALKGVGERAFTAGSARTMGRCSRACRSVPGCSAVCKPIGG